MKTYAFMSSHAPHWLLAAGVALSGCAKTSTTDGTTGKTGTAASGATTVDPYQDPSLQLSTSEIVSMYSNASCDPLAPTTPIGVGDGGLPDYYRGVVGHVTVPPAGFNSNNFQSLDQFTAANGAQTLDPSIYLTSVNIPTRPFDSGFPLLSGELLEDATGHTLMESFRLDFAGFLELGSGDPEGEYEVAVLADDGVRLKTGVTPATYLESPAIHATQMVCGSGSLSMIADASLPIALSYFQGPRYHIALTMLWRKAGQGAEPLCGMTSNEDWFNYHVTPTQPRQAYLDLESRGWSVVGAKNLRVPASTYMNPCLSSNVQRNF